MEHPFEKRSPAPLNFILICQEFESPSSLRLYLEGKGCTVIQQDGTLVGIGTATPSNCSPFSPLQTREINSFSPSRDIEIHAYIQVTGNWNSDGLTKELLSDRANGYAERRRKTLDEREETLCVAFINGNNFADASSLDAYDFYEEAIAQVRSAYERHKRHLGSSALGSHSLASPSLASLSEGSKPAKETFYLTAREHEILKWVSEGKGCWETGTILGISERTVKFHLQNIYRKLNVVNRAQAITKAMRHSLI